jgi:hypothetical protein
MEGRLQLQTLLKELLTSNEVYLQAPKNTSMVYPAILYTINDAFTIHANNSPYHNTWRYQVTFITEDPEDETINKLISLPLCNFDRHFVAEQLHHFNFNLYY